MPTLKVTVPSPVKPPMHIEASCRSFTADFAGFNHANIGFYLANQCKSRTRMASYNSLDGAFDIPESTYILFLQAFCKRHSGNCYLPGTLSFRRNLHIEETSGIALRMFWTLLAG
jgi:hypothetical protein